MQQVISVNIRKLRTFLNLVLIAGLAILPSACSRGKGKEENKSVKIGAILPLTGDAATYGTSCKRGMQVASSMFSVQVVIEDSAADPKRAISAYRKLVDVEGVSVVLGDMFSAPTLAFAPLAQTRGVLVISPTSGAEAVPRVGSCIFSLYPTAQQEGAFMARYLVSKSPGGGTVGVVASQEEVYRGLAEGFTTAIRESPNWKVDFVELFAPDTRDFRNIVAKFAHPGSADAIYAAGSKAFVANLIKQSKQLGFSGDFFSQSTLFDPSLVNEFGQYLNGVLFSGPFFDPTANIEPTKSFVTSYRAAYNDEPDVWAAYGYDAVLVAQKAWEACRDCDGRALAARVAQLSLQGVTGPIRFDEQGGAIRSFGIFTFRDGVLERVR